MSLTIADLEKVQAEHPDWKLELVDGQIILMSPSDAESSEIGVEFSAQLRNWVKPRRLGRVFDASGGFILPNSDLRAPDVSFVVAQRLKQSLRSFAALVPDLIVAVKSKSDRIRPLREKLEQFLALGAQIGILIDPDSRTVTVYRPSSEPMTFRDGDTLTLPDLLPGWELPIADLWPPVFE